MHSSQARRAPLLLKIAVGLVMLFLAFPAAIIVLYGFTTEDRLQTFPPPGLTLDWFPATLQRPDLWDALSLSLGLAAISTVFATILGLLAASAVNRMKF